MLLSKVLICKGGEHEKPKILILALIGVAAININGITIHSGLGINVGGKLYSLSEQHRAAFRNKLSEVRLIIKMKYQWYRVYCFFKFISD